MEQINKVEVLGTMGNVRIYNPPGQPPFARFSVVTKRVYYQKSTDSDIVENTWHSVVLNQDRNFPDLSILQGGGTCHVIGRIRNSKYLGQDGQERYSSDIIAQSVKLLNEPSTIPV